MRVQILDRRLREGEWNMVRAFVARTSREDLRRRFGYPLDFGDEPTLRRAFDVTDGAGTAAFLLDETASVAAIAHRARTAPAEAEVALIVRSDLQRRGLGEFLLREMISRSARQGFAALSALINRDNRAALRLAVKIGYVPRSACGFAVEIAFPLGAAA
jgi:acetyltransferase